MLRAPLLARGELRRTWRAPGGPGAEDREALIGYITDLGGDERFREALEVSSPSLAGQVAALERGEKPRTRDLVRAARSLTRYWLRAASRPTPFGLMAGVAAAGFGPSASAAWGDAHSKHVRPDRARLNQLVSGWQSDPRLVGALRVSVNSLCRERGDRLVLPFASNSGGEDGGTRAASGASARTLRLTPVVAAVLRHASKPVAWPDLRARLEAEFAGAKEGAVSTLLLQLIRAGVLLTNLQAPPGRSDALAHLLDVLPAQGGGAARAEVCRWQEALREYAATPVGAGTRQWRAMRAALPGGEAAQVDLLLDSRVTLPESVAGELERAAGVLWRISAPQPHPLTGYHAEFLERYGLERLVPVGELLDEDAGLGAPAGYRMPAGDRATEPRDGGPRCRRRETLLLRIAQEATARGETEVRLDGALVEKLAADGPGDREAPGSLELYAQVVANGLEALDAGDFTLVLSPYAATPLAGIAFGRFAHLLEQDGRLRKTVRAAAPRRPGALPVQVHYRPAADRHGNVGQAPDWLDHRVTVGTHVEPGPGTLGLDDLLVGAGPREFRIFSKRLGREVSPQIFHALRRDLSAPNAVRFLEEAVTLGQHRLRPWDWGSLASAPFLPAIRVGRVVLCPARWRLESDTVRAQDTAAGSWEAALDAWRARWRVPRAVELVQEDQRLPLDLSVPAHRDLLRREAGNGTVTLQSAAEGEDLTAGWLRDPKGGAHAVEIVAALARAGSAPASAPRPLPPVRHFSSEHLPGGEWLYAKLYTAAARQNELLTHRLAALLTDPPEGVDQTHFLRYRDPDPHLRLRFHGDPGVLRDVLLPRVHELTAALRAEGLVRGLALDTYRPETERYGGAEALPAAERVFAADSALVLRRLADGHPDVLLETATDLVLLARAFHGGKGGKEDGWATWLLETYPKREEYHDAFAGRRTAALRAIRLDAGAPPPSGPARRLYEEAARYGDVLRALSTRQPWARPAEVLPALLHLHCNRRLGIDPGAEARAHAIARGAVAAHQDRLRATRGLS
ncbi:thiopeptide-type bacteriocin biosynthesis protein [Streptomyces sp. DW26H14]|uniref:thiopeptide-type bacteriocin biosynthesis protein n=1 Tax=Streptomyces sp. DW26H14 TaxID=3435395 RepID=UPI00403D7D73